MAALGPWRPGWEWPVQAKAEYNDEENSKCQQANSVSFTCASVTRRPALLDTPRNISLVQSVSQSAHIIIGSNYNKQVAKLIIKNKTSIFRNFQCIIDWSQPHSNKVSICRAVVPSV